MSIAVFKGNASGTGTVTLETPNTNTDKTISLPDRAGTLSMDGPAFKAYANGSQTGISSGVFTKVNLGTEEFDTANCFADSRFTPNVAGYYQVNATLWIYQGSANLNSGFVNIWKNGGWYADGSFLRNAGGSTTVPEIGTCVSTVVYMNGTTDYLELYSWGSTTSGTYEVIADNQSRRVHFSGFLVRAA